MAQNNERFEMRFSERERDALILLQRRLGLHSKAEVMREALALLYEKTPSSEEKTSE